MARLTRYILPGQPQHVIQRGNNREPIFYDYSDYRFYLGKLAAACQKHDCSLHAYVLMTNHVHLLITPHELYRRLGTTKEERQAAYRALFRHRLAKCTLEELREATNKAWILGDDRFRERIASQLSRRALPKARGGDRKSEEYRKKREINRV